MTVNLELTLLSSVSFPIPRLLRYLILMKHSSHEIPALVSMGEGRTGSCSIRRALEADQQILAVAAIAPAEALVRWSNAQTLF